MLNPFHVHSLRGGWDGQVRLFYGGRTGLDLAYANDEETDLANLAPVCTRHHGAIHSGQLTIARQADWSFTTTYKTLRPPGHTTAAA